MKLIGFETCGSKQVGEPFEARLDHSVTGLSLHFSELTLNVVGPEDIVMGSVHIPISLNEEFDLVSWMSETFSRVRSNITWVGGTSTITNIELLLGRFIIRIYQEHPTKVKTFIFATEEVNEECGQNVNISSDYKLVHDSNKDRHYSSQISINNEGSFVTLSEKSGIWKYSQLFKFKNKPTTLDVLDYYHTGKYPPVLKAYNVEPIKEESELSWRNIGNYDYLPIIDSHRFPFAFIVPKGLSSGMMLLEMRSKYPEGWFEDIVESINNELKDNFSENSLLMFLLSYDVKWNRDNIY